MNNDCICLHGTPGTLFDLGITRQANGDWLPPGFCPATSQNQPLPSSWSPRLSATWRTWHSVDKDLPTKIIQSLFQVRSLRSFKLNPAMTTSHRLSDLSWDPMSHLKVSPASSANAKAVPCVAPTVAHHKSGPFQVVFQPFSAALVFSYFKSK